MTENNFPQFNSQAEATMYRLIVRDYSGERPVLTTEEAKGYLNLLSQGGLFLVDAGSGSFDTYLSLADIEALTSAQSGVDHERTVRLHGDHISGLQMTGTENTISLKDLKKYYAETMATDSEGNDLPETSATRLSRLKAMFLKPLDAASPPTSEGHSEEAPHEPQAETVGEEKPEYLMDEVERIHKLINEQLEAGEITESEAMQLHMMADSGQLLLVDMDGDGEFEDYLSRDDAEALMADPTQAGHAIHLYNRDLTADGTGVIPVEDLGEAFDRQEALGASMGGSDRVEAKPVDEALAKEEKKPNDVSIASPMGAAGLESLPEEEKGAKPEVGIPAQLLAAGRAPVQKEKTKHDSVEKPFQAPKPVELPAFQTKTSAQSPDEATGDGDIPLDIEGKTERDTQVEGQKQQMPAPNQQPIQQRRPKRYQPAQPARPSARKRRRWLAIPFGVGAASGPGFVLLSRMGESPDYTAVVLNALSYMTHFLA